MPRVGLSGEGEKEQLEGFRVLTRCVFALGAVELAIWNIDRRNKTRCVETR